MAGTGISLIPSSTFMIQPVVTGSGGVGEPQTWRFPAALNRTFSLDIYKKQEEAPDFSQKFQDWGNGTLSEYAPSPFRSDHTRPDTILDAIYDMNFNQRLGENDPDSRDPLEHPLGHELNKVYVKDEIVLKWCAEGEQSPAPVRMTCHICFDYAKDGSGWDMAKACDNFTDTPVMSYYSDLLSSDPEEMNDRFTNGGRQIELLDEVDPDKMEKLQCGSKIVMPELASTGMGVAMCMFTLNWNPFVKNLEHTVPFYVRLKDRPAPRPVHGMEVDWPWEFSERWPTGREVKPGNVPGGSWYTPSGSVGSTVIPTSPSESEGNKPNVKVIVGAVVGSIVGLLAVLLGFGAVCWRRRKQRTQNSAVAEIVEYNAPSNQAGVVQEAHVTTAAEKTSMSKGKAYEYAVDESPPAYHEAMKQ